METFFALLAICAGIHRPPVNSPHKGQWRGALIFSLICVWINGWVNNGEAGDLRRFRAHVTSLLPDGTKPLHEPMLTYHQSGLVVREFRGRAQNIKLQNDFEKFTCEIISTLKANELTRMWWHRQLFMAASRWFNTYVAERAVAVPSSWNHYNDVRMSTMASQITSLAIIFSIVYSGANQRKHQGSASLAFVWGIHRPPVNFPYKGPVTREVFPFGDVIMYCTGSNGNIASWNWQGLNVLYMKWNTESSHCER